MADTLCPWRQLGAIRRLRPLSWEMLRPVVRPSVPRLAERLGGALGGRNCMRLPVHRNSKTSLELDHVAP